MPELPEVETARLGIAPHILGKTFANVIVRQPQLRWPIPQQLSSLVQGLQLTAVKRRGKYILLITQRGNVLLHLGMSGNLRITDSRQVVKKHDHVDFVFNDGTILRLNDPRKFGAVLWCDDAVEQHPLLCKLGPEPLSESFTAAYLHRQASKRRIALKSLIMDSHVVVGVGNIYASEALFMARLLPTRHANALSAQECQRLVEAIQEVLQRAITQGGTTLRDFTNAEGKPGYFKQQLAVYGRADQPCNLCAQPIQQLKISQRASYYCLHCQH